MEQHFQNPETNIWQLKMSVVVNGVPKYRNLTESEKESEEFRKFKKREKRLQNGQGTANGNHPRTSTHQSHPPNNRRSVSREPVEGPSNGHRRPRPTRPNDYSTASTARASDCFDEAPPTAEQLATLHRENAKRVRTLLVSLLFGTQANTQRIHVTTITTILGRVPHGYEAAAEGRPFQLPIED